MRGRSPEQLRKDAVIIQGILDLMEREAEPVTSRLIQMTQHIGEDAVCRLMGLLEDAKVVAHPTTTKRGRKVRCRSWRLTRRAERGEIPGAEELARGMRA